MKAKTILTAILLVIFQSIYSQALNCNELNMIKQFYDLNTTNFSNAGAVTRYAVANYNCPLTDVSTKLNFSGFTASVIDGEYRITKISLQDEVVTYYDGNKIVDKPSKERIKFPANFFSSFPYLKELRMVGVGLENLPDDITTLKYITEIEIDQNPIKQLPSNIGDLKTLTKLSVQRGMLESLPNSVGNLNKLTDLYLGSSKIKDLPDSFFKLTQLQQIFVDGNPEINGDDIDNLISSFIHLSDLRVSTEYSENCAVVVNTNSIYNDVVDALPPGSKILNFDGVDGTNKEAINLTAKAFKIIEVDGNSKLAVDDVVKFKEIQQKIAITVIKFECPQGVFYKRYAWKAQHAGNEDNSSSNFNKDSRCAVPDDLFMPTNFNLSVTRTKIGIGEKTFPIIEFPGVSEPLLSQYKKRITYTVEDIAPSTNVGKFNLDDSSATAVSAGRFKITAYSGKISRSVEIEVGSQAMAIEVSHPRMIRESGKKTLYLYDGIKEYLDIKFTPSDFFNQTVTGNINPISGSPINLFSPGLNEPRYSVFSPYIGETQTVFTAKEANRPQDTVIFKVIKNPSVGLEITGKKVINVGDVELFRFTSQGMSSIVSVKWTVTNSNATVSKEFPLDTSSPNSGTAAITANKSGDFYIKLEVTDKTGATYGRNLHVKINNYIKSVSNIKPSLVAVGESVNLSYDYTPENAVPSYVMWQNPNDSYFSLINDAVIKGKTIGTSNIITNLKNGTKISHSIQVYQPLEKCTVFVNKYEAVDISFDLRKGLTYSPSNATFTDFEFEIKKILPFVGTESITKSPIITYEANYNYEIKAFNSRGVRCMVYDKMNKKELLGSVHTYEAIKYIEPTSYITAQTVEETAKPTEVDVTPMNILSFTNNINISLISQEDTKAKPINSYIKNEIHKSLPNSIFTRKSKKYFYTVNWWDAIFSSVPKSSNSIGILHYNKPSTEEDYKFQFKIEPKYNPHNVSATQTLYVINRIDEVRVKITNAKPNDLEEYVPVFEKDDKIEYELEVLGLDKRIFKNYVSSAWCSMTVPKHDIKSDTGYFYNTLNWMDDFYIRGYAKDTLGRYQDKAPKIYFYTSKIEDFKLTVPKRIPAGSNLTASIGYENFTPEMKSYYDHIFSETILDVHSTYKRAVPTSFTTRINPKTTKYSNTLTIPTNKPDKVTIRARNAALPHIKKTYIIDVLDPVNFLKLEPARDTVKVGERFTVRVRYKENPPYSSYPYDDWYIDEREWSVFFTSDIGNHLNNYRRCTCGNRKTLSYSTPGKVNIKYTDIYSGLSATAEIVVVNAINSINIKNDTVAINSSKLLNATIDPTDASNKNLNWIIIGDNHSSSIQDNGQFNSGGTFDVTVQVKATSRDGFSTESNSADIFIFKPVENIIITTPGGKTVFDKDDASIQLDATVLAPDATFKELVWTSSTPGVSIDQSGKVYPNGYEGPISVTATTKYGNKITKTINLTTINFVENIDIISKDTLFVGMTDIAKAITSPINSYPINWEVDNNTNLSIDENTGSITTLTHGHPTITAEATDGSGINESKKVRIFDVPTSITINGGNKFTQGDVIQFTSTIGPSTAYQKTNWDVISANDESIHAEATIDKDGKLTVTKPGWINITATPSVLGYPIPSPTETKKILILPNHIGQYTFKVNEDTVIFKQKNMSFQYDILDDLNSIYYSLNIKSYTEKNDFVMADNSYTQTNTTQIIEPAQIGKYTYSLLSTLDPSLVYEYDSVIVLQDTAKVAYDTIIVGETKSLEFKLGETWNFLSGSAIANLTNPSGSTPNITGQAIGTVVLERKNSSSTITRTDSIEIVNGVTSLSLSPNTASVIVGTNKSLTATIGGVPHNSALNWTVEPIPSTFTKNSNTDYTISSNSIGQFKVTVNTTDGSNLSETSTIEFYNKVNTVSIRETELFTYPSDTILVGEVLTLQSIITPNNAKNKGVSWTVSDATKIGLQNSSSASPTITGLAATNGTAVDLTITSNENPSIKSSISIHVIKLVEGLTIDIPDTIWLSTPTVDSSITAEVLPNAPDASNENVVWLSSDISGLEIINSSANGQVATLRAKKKGKFIISVETEDQSTLSVTDDVVVRKAITDININLSEDTVGYSDAPQIVNVIGTTNSDASSNKIDWTLIDKDGNPIPSSDAEFDASGNVIVKNSNQTMIIIMATSDDGSNLSVISKDTINVVQLVTSVELSDEVLGFEPDYFYTDEILTIDNTILPANATNKTMRWGVSDVDLVINNSSDEKIELSALDSGSFSIRVEATDGSGKFYTKPIETAVRMTSISLTLADTIYEGEVVKLNPEVLPAKSEPIKFYYTLFSVTPTGFNVVNDPNLAYIDQATHSLHLKEVKNEVTMTLVVGVEAEDKYGSKISYTNLSLADKIRFGNSVDSLKVSFDKDTIYVGEQVTGTASFYPSYATNKNVSWTSSDNSLLTPISRNLNTGVFEALKPGSVEVVATSRDANSRESKIQTITILERMTSFKIPDYKIVNNGFVYQYDLSEVQPTTATDRDVEWKVFDVSNALITDANQAVISSSGLLKPGPLSVGNELIIKAISTDGTNIEDVDTVIVYQQVDSIAITGLNRLATTQTFEYTAEIFPTNATNKTLNWKIDNARIATLSGTDNEKRNLTGSDVGYVNLYAEATDGSTTRAEKLIEVYNPVSSIRSALSGTSEYLHVGQTKGIITQLVPTYSRTPLAFKLVEGSSFVSLNDNNVTGLSEGLAKVEIKALDYDSLKDTIDVSVIIPVSSINVEAASALIVGDSTKLNITINPSNATISDYRIISTNENVTVLDNGTIIGNYEGTVDLIISSIDGTNITTTITMEVYQAVLGFNVEFKKLDKQFFPSAGAAPIKGTRIVTQDSVEIFISPYPDNATYKEQKISLNSTDNTDLKHKNISTGLDKVEYYSRDLSTDYIIVSSTDPKGVSDTIELESVKWVEKLQMTRSRSVVPIFGEIFLAPNIRSGILPTDASNRELLYDIDNSELATIDNFGYFKANGVTGIVETKAMTTDGSKITDSIEIEIADPTISLKLQGNKTSLPINYREKVIVTTFPENLEFKLEVIDGKGEIDIANNFYSSNLGLVKIVATANYHHFELKDTLEVTIANKTLFIVSKDLVIRIGDEVYIDYINYADETTWTTDSIANIDNLFTVDNAGLIRGQNYGVGRVFVENEVGSRDTAQVTVLLNSLEVNRGLHLYPNPNRNTWLNIQLKNLEGKITYNVYDAKGNLITSGIKDSRQFRLDLPESTVSGRYLLEAIDSLGRVERKWFIIVLQ